MNLSDSPLRKKKKLRFDTRVRVTLIPTIAEYKDAGLNTFLWCSPTELQSYKFSAFEDVKDFMRESHCDNFTQAMKSLLQVDNTAEATTSAAAHSKVAVAPTVKKISNSEASTETDDVKADHACNAVHMPKG